MSLFVPGKRDKKGQKGTKMDKKGQKRTKRDKIMSLFVPFCPLLSLFVPVTVNRQKDKDKKGRGTPPVLLGYKSQMI